MRHRVYSKGLMRGDRRNLGGIRSTMLICMAVIVAGPAAAQRASELSADLPDAKTQAIQDKVERLFAEGEFKRAFLIYRRELAPLGDKYAQYMVGYMYDEGLSVDPDPVHASAWYRLSAERGTPEFIKVRDHRLNSLSDAERRRSDVRYLQLRREYSDIVVLLSSIRRDVRELRLRTGSRLTNQAMPIQIMDARTGRMISGAEYYGDLARRLMLRLRLLRELGDLDAVSIPKRLSDVNVDELEALVQEKIESGFR